MRRRVFVGTDLKEYKQSKQPKAPPPKPATLDKNTLVEGSKEARLMAKAKEARRLLARCETVLKSIASGPEEQMLVDDLGKFLDYVELG